MHKLSVKCDGLLKEEAIPSRKSPLLVGLTMVLWAVILAFMGWRLVPLVLSGKGVVETLCLVTFSGLLVIFWLLGAYFLALSVTYCWQRLLKGRGVPETLATAHRFPSVAILYPTCDDFQREAVLSCLAQDYPGFHVFLLDDSRRETCRQAVDAFGAEFPEKVSVVRRSNRSGFKAGNLNHGLRTAAADFSLFAVMDADEKIPPDFLRKTVSEIETGGYAFVQAGHVPNPRQTEIFARAMGQTILPFWEVLLAAKSQYGCVACVGHGMLVRRDCWLAVGGFPEVASEDLAFTSVLLEHGMRGFYLDSVVCEEDFPTSLHSFKKQQERYTVGVFEVFCRFVPRLMLSRKVSWIEKTDLVLSCLPLYIPILCVVFLITSGLTIPLCFGRFSHLVATTAFGTLRIPFLQAFDARFQLLWSPGFVAVSSFLSLAPAFPMFTLALFGRIRRPLRLLVASNLMCMATNLAMCRSLLGFFWRRSVQFSPTGSFRDGRGDISAKRRASGVSLIEPVLSLGLGLALLCSLNLGLAGVALCPLLGSMAAWRGGVSTYICAMAAFSGIIGQTILGVLFAHAPRGHVPLVFSVHF